MSFVYCIFMANHGKKIIVPIVVTTCLLSYSIAVIAGLFIVNLPNIIIIIVVVISVIVAVVLIFVMIERIKEIMKGEEDDLGKY